MSITITPILVPPRTPPLQPQAFPDPSWTNGKRQREDEDGSSDDTKRPRICPPLADALSFLASDVWTPELDISNSPCPSTDTDSHSENALETDRVYVTSTSSSLAGALGIPDASVEQTALTSEEDYQFQSGDELLAWIGSLRDIDDELNLGDLPLSPIDTPSSPSTSDDILAMPSTSDIPPSPHLAPQPILAVEGDRVNGTGPTEDPLLHYIPPPVKYPRKFRAGRTLDTEDLRKNVVNNLRRHRLYPFEAPALPPLYERDFAPWETLGTPPRNIDERTPLDPPAGASDYKYTLDPDEYGDTYSASELFGPDAATVKVARSAPLRPRAEVDFCELTDVEHTLTLKTGEHSESGTGPTATARVRADQRAVEFWRANANAVVEAVCARKAAEALAEELAAFFEGAAAGRDEEEEEEEMEAVAIPDLPSEADVSFYDEDGSSTGSESSSSEYSEEDGEGVFDYDGWVADNLLL